jgi:uncharacterized membrane protein required for colicin V production
MNWFDFILVGLVLVGVIVGYMQGLLRQLTGLLALYIGLVMAAYFHGAVERRIDFFVPKMADVAQESLAFLAILALVYVALHWLGQQAFPETRLAALGFLDQLGGMVIGFLVVGVQIGVGLLIFRFLSGVSWIRGDTVRLAFAQAIEASPLVPTFQTYLAFVARTLLPWLPAGLPAFFRLP